eukprot:2102503-Pyramimonas_sp.AAC.1
MSLSFLHNPDTFLISGAIVAANFSASLANSFSSISFFTFWTEPAAKKIAAKPVPDTLSSSCVASSSSGKKLTNFFQSASLPLRFAVTDLAAETAASWEIFVLLH